ncbi:MAG: CDP-glycerol:glycerophosphate glycerophosphotransferase [Eubacterium sp.]|nr:CDP-glycerol:glycerophosphate glycerophosphotransferase [Eubacterium sp.]
MKISVIVPFNGEKIYYRDCLDSIRKQNYKDIEVIMVCDGCGRPNLDNYADLNLKVVELAEHSGVAAVRNEGIKHATGEYVMFLDIDDYVLEDTIELLVAKLEDNRICYADQVHSWYSRRIFLDNKQGDMPVDEEENQEGMEDEKSEVTDNPYEHIFMRAGTFQSITILGMLIPKRVFEDDALRFDEESVYFSDHFLLARLLQSDIEFKFVESAKYIKRRHNDPINNPSMLQKKDGEKKIYESMVAYTQMRTTMSDEKSTWLDYKYIRHIIKKISAFLVEKPKKRADVYAKMQKTAMLVGNNGVENLIKRHGKRVLKMARTGNPEVFVRKTINHSRWRTLKTIATRRSKLKRWLYDNVYAKMKMLDNTIMFESFFGKSYSDSPKYIYEYLNENYAGKYNYIWVYAGEKHKIPYKAKQVKRFTFSYFYYMARCKYHVFNGRQPVYFIKRKGNVFLETWHGTPLKKLVFDMDDVTTASPLYKEQFYIQTRSWDYLVAPNQFSEDVFRHAFLYDGKMLETGYPRNDILYKKHDKELVDSIKDEIGIPRDKKVILYAPTWRDDEFYGHAMYKFTLQLDLKKMQEELGDEYIVLLRTHYFISDFLDLSEHEGFAYNVSKYDDIARLYLVSDMLITDYSSVFFDYANLKRPMIFYMYDLEKYASVLRGFYIDIEEELPGPIVLTTEKVIESIRNIDEVKEKYSAKYEEFSKKYCAWEDGTASKRIVEAVFDNKE